MGFNPNFALTNAQMRDQGLQGALENFMGYFKTVRAQKDEEEQAGALKAISQADTAARGATTGAARLGMDAAGMPTGMQGAGVEPAQAAQQHLATIKANYLNKYGKMPATGQDMLAADLEREDKLAGFGDNRDARTAKKAQQGKVDAFGKTVAADPALSGTERAFYDMEPKAYGERLKPVGITYLPGAEGYVGAPSKTGPGAAQGPAIPVTTPGGSVVKPVPKPSQRTPEQIEEDAAAKARGAASVAKPLTAEQVQNVQAKIQTLDVTKRQLAGVRKAFEGIKNTVSAGPGGNMVPTQSGQSFDVAVDGLRNSIRTLTRTPGEGSMSDFEGRISQAQLPSRGKYEASTEQQIAQLEDLVTTLEGGYLKMIPAAPGAAPGTDAGAAVPIGTVKTNKQGMKVRKTAAGWEAAE